MSLKGLKWLAVVLPLLFLVAVDHLRFIIFGDHAYGAAGLAFFFTVLALAVVLFSHTIFGVIARLQRRVLQQNDHLAVLNRIAAASAESPGLEPLLATVLEEVLGVLRADAGLVCSVNLEEQEHSAIGARGLSLELVRRINRVKLGDDPISEEVVKTQRPVVIEQVFKDPRVAEIAAREGIRSAISAPLKSHGEVTGILAVATRQERRFTANDLALLASVGGQLGMAVKNAALYERLLQRNREMEALLAVSRAGSTALALPQVLDRALDTILEVTSAEAAEIWLAEKSGDLLHKRHRGAAPDVFSERTRFSVGEGLPGKAAETRSPIVVHNLAEDPNFRRAGVTEAGFQTYCALPLLHRERLLAVLGVAARSAEALTRPEELRLLAGIGEVISVAIENARLYEQVQDEAVLEERERIAREMHDGLAQVLGYINTQSLAIRKFLGSGKTAAAREELSRMEDAVRQVYADVREDILGLRTAPGPAGEFLPTLQSYLERYKEMTGVNARMEVHLPADGLRLVPATEIQLMRIIQEALSNVRRHARASAVQVSFHGDGETLQVAVQDDGRGFDPDRRPPRGWPRFGLQTMRERAEAVGGHFRIESRPGAGTRVLIQLPVGTGEKVYAGTAG